MSALEAALPAVGALVGLVVLFGVVGLLGYLGVLSVVFHTLRPWWRLALPVGLLLAFGIAGSIWFAFGPAYRAEAWLRIEERAPFIAFPQEVDSRSFVATQVQLIRSPLVLGPALAQELEEPDPETGDKTVGALPEANEQDAPIEWLQEEIAVEAVGGSELFTVSFAGRDPEDSAHIVNAVVNSYFDLRAQEEAQRTQRVIELLEQERERRAAEVMRLRENVRELSKQATGKDPFRPLSESAINAAEQPLDELRSRLTETRMQREILRAEIIAIGEFLASERSKDGDEPAPHVSHAIVEQAVAEHPQVKALQAILDIKRTQLHDYREKARDGEENPVCEDLAKDIESDERELVAIRAELLPEFRSRLKSERIAGQEAELAERKRELRKHELLEQTLAEKFDSELAKLQEFSGDTLELKFAQADLVLEEEVFARIAERITKLQTEQRAPARVRLMSEAAPPKKPVELIPYKLIVLGFTAGLCFPFALAVLWELRVRRVTSARQLQKRCRDPVLGSIARLPVRTTSFSPGTDRRVGHALHVFEESVDGLRTRLALAPPLRDLKVFAVTSAVGNEGKTSVAVQLAVSSARASGEPTLLIDGNLRGPDVHQVLETRMAPGLAEVLGGKCPLDEAIITDWSPQVHVLPAGELRESPHKLFGGGAFPPLVEKVRSTYRHVVIDAPAILAAGEALVIADAADASIVCAMRDASRIGRINKALADLEAAEVKVAGLVLNGVPVGSFVYRCATQISLPMLNALPTSRPIP
jgi:capsular exopolysaccharide synthesis family protein